VALLGWGSLPHTAHLHRQAQQVGDATGDSVIGEFHGISHICLSLSALWRGTKSCLACTACRNRSQRLFEAFGKDALFTLADGGQHI